MARMARFKICEEEAWYHVHSRTAGVKGEHVLSKPLARKRLMALIQHYRRAYFCDVAGVTVMGNHWAFQIFPYSLSVDRERTFEQGMTWHSPLYSTGTLRRSPGRP